MLIANLEEKIKNADFSRETDLKDALRERLFGKAPALVFPKPESGELSERELSLFSAAGTVFYGKTPARDKGFSEKE